MAAKWSSGNGNGNKNAGRNRGNGRKGDWANRVQDYMQGRNGSDDMGRACIWVAIALLAVSLVFNFIDFTVSWVLSIVALAFIGYGFFRMMSPNFEARRKENTKWVQLWTKISLPVKRFISRRKEWRKYHKEYHIYKCEKCGQSLRVPKGKGKIKVTCPKCKTSFVKKS